MQQRDTHVLRQLAEEFNLTYTAFGSPISTQDGPVAGTLILSEAWGTALEPAPVTPSVEDSAPWRLLSGTIKATFNTHRHLDGPNNIFVSPGIMSGNTGRCTRQVRVQSKLDKGGLSTDTKHYWNLTRHIFRYNHQDVGDGRSPPLNIHTVNERMFGYPFRVQIADTNKLRRHLS